jgi:molecular chaperone HscB
LQASQDYFQFFDLRRRLDIDLADLEKRYYQLSRKLHPDLFARKPQQERLDAEEATATLNDAYRTLKDPVRRAEYVLKLNGLDIAHERAPQDLLEEVFELNMALEELRSGDDSARPQLAEAARKFVAMREEIDRDLQDEFIRYDDSSESLGRIRAILNRRNYIRNLISEVDKVLTTRD